MRPLASSLSGMSSPKRHQTAIFHSTAASLVKQLQAMDAQIAGVAFLIDRTGGAVDFGVPFYACRTLEIESYDPEACPLCKKGLRLVET
jgi:hypothetical protein